MAKREYMAYLLRLWRERQEAPWRAMLENANSGERIAFATLPELFTYLESKTDGSVVLSNQLCQQKEMDHEK